MLKHIFIRLMKDIEENKAYDFGSIFEKVIFKIFYIVLYSQNEFIKINKYFYVSPEVCLILYFFIRITTEKLP